MNVIVASRNPVKINAVREAFAQQFPERDFGFEPISVASGVGEQPMSDAETRRGAHNRVDRARESRPDAEFWVGMEGGLERHGGLLLASAWMVVASRDGRRSEARTPTLPLPPQVQSLVESGMELGDANDRVFATLNSKQGGGAFGLLTDGYLTRGGVYRDTLILALVPHSHRLWGTRR